MAKTTRDSFKFMLRLPDDLRDQLRKAAEENGRSVTAEILARLEMSFEPGDTVRKLDASLVRGIQIGTVTFLLANEDPIGALKDLHQQLMKPLIDENGNLSEVKLP